MHDLAIIVTAENPDPTHHSIFKVLGKDVLPTNQTIVAKAKFNFNIVEKKIKVFYFVAF